MNKGCKATVSFCKLVRKLDVHEQKLKKKFKMLNYSFVKKNEAKPDNMGNMENSSSLETVVVINCIHHW